MFVQQYFQLYSNYSAMAGAPIDVPLGHKTVYPQNWLMPIINIGIRSEYKFKPFPNENF